MENASKALLMAGGVLIGVLVISLAVYLFADFGATSAEINAQNAQKQITAFNSNFTAYQGNKDEITIYDIVSLATYAKENNIYYDDSLEYKITVYIGNSPIQDFTREQLDELIKKYIHDNGELKKFKCEDGAIGYNGNGRVNSITFIEN